MAYVIKKITFYKNTPFDIEQKHVALGTVSGGGVGTTSLNNILNQAKVFSVDLGETNFRIDDECVVFENPVSSANALLFLYTLDYAKIEIVPAKTTINPFVYYAFITHVELIDSETSNANSGIGAVKVHFKVDVWTTFVTQAIDAAQMKFSGGTLRRISNTRAASIALQTTYLFPKKLPIEPIAKTPTTEVINVELDTGVTNPSTSELHIPQKITPWFWGLTGEKPSNVLTSKPQKWVTIAVVASGSVVGDIRMFAGYQTDDFTNIMRQANTVGSAVYLGFEPSSGSAITWEKVTIKNVYIVPREVVEIDDEEVSYTRVFLTPEQISINATNEKYYTFFRLKPSIKVISRGVASDGDDKIYTFGTPFHRLTIDELNKETERAYPRAIFNTGGDTVAIRIATATEEIDVTQDFEFLTAKPLANEYWQDNKSAIALQTIAATGTLATGIASLNPLAIGGALLGGAQQFVNISKGFKQAPQIRGGGYVDITFLYGGIFTQEYDAINETAVNNAILSKGFETFQPIKIAWQIKAAAVQAMITAGIKSFYIQADDVFVGTLPKEYAQEISDILSRGVRIYLDITKFRNKDITQ